MRCDARQYARLARHGPATAVSVRPTGTAIEQYQVSLGNRHSLREAGVIGLPSWSEKQTQSETWTKVPRLSATCPRRIVAFDGGKGNIDRCMEFGDTFDSAAVDASKWTTLTTNGTVAISGGACVVSSTGGGDTSINSIATFGAGHAIRTRIRSGHSGTTPAAYEYLYFRNIANGYANSSIQTFLDPGNGAAVDNGDTSASQAQAWTANTYGICQCSIHGTTQVFTVNDGAAKTFTGYTPSTGKIKIETYGNYANIAVDWILVRKCVASEPLAGTAKPSATNRALSRPLSASRAMQMAVAG